LAKDSRISRLIFLQRRAILTACLDDLRLEREPWNSPLGLPKVTFVILIKGCNGRMRRASVTLMWDSKSRHTAMEVLSPRSTRRNTRLRVELPITVTSMDRRHPFSARCVALVISLHGCGLQASQSLPLETPVLLCDLPAGGNASGRVASCQPIGSDGKHFLIGVSLYNPGNIWGIVNPPEDWNCPVVSGTTSGSEGPKAAAKSKDAWPYNIFSGHGEAHPGRR
jgi:hypothetical protein